MSLVRPRAAASGPVSGRKLLCFKHLRYFKGSDFEWRFVQDTAGTKIFIIR